MQFVTYFSCLYFAFILLTEKGDNKIQKYEKLGKDLSYCTEHRVISSIYFLSSIELNHGLLAVRADFPENECKYIRLLNMNR